MLTKINTSRYSERLIDGKPHWKMKKHGFFMFFLTSGGKMVKIDLQFYILTVLQVDPIDAHKNKLISALRYHI